MVRERKSSISAAPAALGTRKRFGYRSHRSTPASPEAYKLAGGIDIRLHRNTLVMQLQAWYKG